MSSLDAFLRLNTPKLHVPTDFIPTRPHDRGWLIPFFGENPVWMIPIAIIPALIATILIFMDQQITSVIINRKEFKLKVIDCSAFSLVGTFLSIRKDSAIIWIYSFYRLRSWFNQSSVCPGLLLPLFSLSHMSMRWKLWVKTPHRERNRNSKAFCRFDFLSQTKKTNPIIPFSSEQRVSALLMAILTGLSVFFTHVLNVRLTRGKNDRLFPFLIYLAYSHARSLRSVHVHGSYCAKKYASMFPWNILLFAEDVLLNDLDFWSDFIIFYATKTSTRFSLPSTCANKTCSSIYLHTNPCPGRHVCSEKY